MKPYYEEAGITIYHGDCRQILPQISLFDLLLTDPPYGLGESMWDTNDKTPKRRWRLHHEQMAWDREIVEVGPLLIYGRYSIVWGGHLLSLPTMRGWLVWNKIIRNFSSGVCELAWTNLDIPIDAFDFSHGQLANEGKVHPTQKPLSLMKWCISLLPEAKTVLDPFCGSGTTLVAAKDMGLEATGIDIEEKYCEMAANRLRQSVLNFEGPPNCPICEKAIGHEWDGCLCLYDEPITNGYV